MCSLCDEYIFCQDERIQGNPNIKSKKFDINTNDGIFYFDIKDTRIPRAISKSAEYLINNPNEIIDYNYRYQSNGQRYGLQNRLFVVNHSHISSNREALVRMSWEAKAKAFKLFLDNISSVHYHTVAENCISTIIYIIEEKDNSIIWKI